MFSDYLARVKLAINEITKATNEPEIYKHIAEALINCLGFNRVTVRKVDWERGVLSLVCYLGFTEEVPSFELPLSEEAGAFGRVAIRGESAAIFEEEEIPSELRLTPKLAKLQKVMRSRSFAIVPIKVKGRVRVVFGVDRKASGKGITPEDEEILGLFSEMAGKSLENLLTQEELRGLLITDELTGLFNRRYFMMRLNEEFEKAKRYGVPLSCCIFDIDNFKLINDAYGHIFGDHVLRQIGKLMIALVRHTDIVARYGGEEFTILFTHTALEDVVKAVERILSVISALIFPYNKKEVQVTATFGISSYPPVSIEKDLLHYADMALYEGKKRYGKNCVVIHTEDGYRIVKKEEHLTSQRKEREITFDSFIQNEEISKKAGIAELEIFDEKTAEKNEPGDSKLFKIIPRALARNLRECYQMTKEFTGSFKVAIRKLKEVKISPLHLGKSRSLTALTLGLEIILPIIILIAFSDKKEEVISPPSGVSASTKGSNQPKSNLSFETPLLDDKGLRATPKEVTPSGENTQSEETREEQLSQVPVKKEKRFSPKKRVQRMSKLRIRKKEEPEQVKKEELKEALRRAFLLY